MRRLIGNNRASSAMEYGLIAALVAVAGVGAMQGLGNRLTMTFANILSNMKAS